MVESSKGGERAFACGGDFGAETCRMTGDKPHKELKGECSRQRESRYKGPEVTQDLEYSRPKLLGQGRGRGV